MFDRDFEIKAIDFINLINKNYEINEDNFLYFPERKIAIALHEKYESSNLYKPKTYFTDLSNKYDGITVIANSNCYSNDELHRLRQLLGRWISDVFPHTWSI